MKLPSMCKQFATFFFLLALCFCCLSAKKNRCKQARLLPLTSVHIIDRNDLSETISNKERLQQFLLMDFCSSQPYQKVLRIYERDTNGNIRSVVTTYHENSNIKQFLEIVNGRAYGNYSEWHENGKMSVSANVIGGTPDVTSAAESTWLFDGNNYVWDEEGIFKAKICYSQGALEGESLYYHSNGMIWKRIPYAKNQIDGCLETFTDCGELVQQFNYELGKRNGLSLRYWCTSAIAYKEEYCQGNLQNAQYFDKDGNLIAEIKNGNGQRAVIGKERVIELQEFVNGVLEGKVKFFDSKGHLRKIYQVKDGIKHGEEIGYYESTDCHTLRPKFSFNWFEGKFQGLVKSWYPNGQMESQKEMANNSKNGVLTAWYNDGNVMMIEEYEKNKLVRGKYFKKDDPISVSLVIQGKGTATLFDAEGHFVQKVNYYNGKPEM